MSAIVVDLRRPARLKRLTASIPWLADAAEREVRLPFACAGFLPVTLIAGSTFGIGLRGLAIHVLAPVAAAMLVLLRRRPQAARLLGRAACAGFAATALYDLFRFGFLWAGLMQRDPIPHIGVALGLHPAWVFGYLWRYLGNGTGLALAFCALGLRGVRAGVLYGLFVCGGLLFVLVVSPLGQEVLFPLNVTTVLMAIGGHAIYGAVLGTIASRQPRTATRAGRG
jgi:hypothetical protein